MRYAFRTVSVGLLFFGAVLSGSAQIVDFRDAQADTVSNGMTTPHEGYRYSWPIISVGGGATFYTGGIHSPRNLSKFSGTRWGIHAQVEQRFGKFFGAKLNLFYGLTAGERHSFTEFDNFQSRLIGTDLRFAFHLDHIMGKKQWVAPYFAVGVGYLNYRTKSDLKDADGNTYHLWDDGSLRDQTQSAQTNGSPQILNRDYTYETVVNASGNTITFPVEAGLRFKMHDYWDFGMGYTHTFILNKFITPANNNKLDNFGYASATVYWYLGQFN